MRAGSTAPATPPAPRARSRARRSNVRPVEIRARDRAEAFVTADGSTIRELLGLPTSSARNQSLAEATLEPGEATQRHYHRDAEEIYYLVEGTGELEVDGERAHVGPGDAILIPP